MCYLYYVRVKMYCKHSFHDSIDNKTMTGDAKREGKLETTQYPAPFDIFCLCFLRVFSVSVALVRERTIPTERPPPVGKVSANFCG